MYEILKKLAERPAPFSHYSAPELWTRPHLAQSMLAFHIDGDNDIASRRSQSIQSIVNWIADRFAVRGKRICDLGCGPGLYANSLAQMGAIVTGVDISPSSLAYARNSAPQSRGGTDGSISPLYIEGNYLDMALPQEQDLVMLIYADYCALSPEQRALLLSRMKDQLKPGGTIILDVFSDRQFAALKPETVIETDLMAGFWAPSPYVGLKKSWLWPERNLGLDHYLISSPQDCFEIYNWMQYFSPDSLKAELEGLGFSSLSLVNILTGEMLAEDYGNEFCAIVTF